MKKIKKIYFVLLAVIALALALPFSVSAESLEDGKTVFGENFTLESGKILDGDLNVVGGVVTIESRAVVNGSVFVLGGVVDIDGTVQGDLTVIGGTVTLENNAVIEGDLFSPAGFIDQEEGSVIQGTTNRSWDIPWMDVDFPEIYQPRVLPMPGMRFFPLLKIAEKFAKTLVFVGLAAIMLLIMPKATEEMTLALVRKPWHILGYGALTALVMVVGGILLSLTICLIPVVVLVGLAFGLAMLAGWLALGYEIGKRMAGIFKTTWHPVVSATLGNLVLYLLAISLDLIPCLGGFLVFMATLFGLGMAVVTLFGSKPYPRPEQTPAEEETVLLVDRTEAESLEPEPAQTDEPASGDVDTDEMDIGKEDQKDQ
jgi:cytoskeletal protein CcmA (bactofilin family)